MQLGTGHTSRVNLHAFRLGGERTKLFDSASVLGPECVHERLFPGRGFAEQVEDFLLLLHLLLLLGALYCQQHVEVVAKLAASPVTA